MYKPASIIQKTEDVSHRIQQQINKIQLDAHWFRRIFHTSAASFLSYYLLPNQPWINLVKIIIPLCILGGISIIEYLRLQSILKNEEFFGLRAYEQKRPAGYLYFGFALVLLLLFFPQQIAIPCILCACFTDPIMGEARYRYGKKHAVRIGFLISFLFFILIWYTANLLIMIGIAVIGAGGAVLGESLKNRYIDDDFLIQIVPASLIYLIHLGFTYAGMDILPHQSIIPITL